MVASYVRDFRFGYGVYSGRPEHSTLEMPPKIQGRYPAIKSSAKAASYVLTTRQANAKLRSSGSTKYKAALREFYQTLRKDYLVNADNRLRFTINSEYSFFERLVYFWFNHFGIATKNRRSYLLVAGAFENEAIRPHVDGYFRDMLHATALHPAMLLTLNQQSSYGPNSPVGRLRGRGFNENLGRELLELYTLGADGPYTQSDVGELALLLTGMQVERKDGIAKFRVEIAEPGRRTILGREYGGAVRSASQIGQVLDDLAIHPSTARYVAQKLAKHFISDTPPIEVINDLEAAFRDSNGHLPTVYGALIYHGGFVPPFQKVRTPLDFVISGLRAARAPAAALDDRIPGTNVSTQEFSGAMMGPVRLDGSGGEVGKLHRVPRDLETLGHQLWGSPGPDGFPDQNTDWLNANGLAQRLIWASKTANLIDRDPIEFASEIFGEVASPDTLNVISRAASRQEGIALALMAPQFNRR